MNGLRRAGGLAVVLGGLVGGGLAGARLAAQGTAGAAKADDRPVPVFEVVSIKPNTSASGGMSWGSTANGISMKNEQLESLVREAYGLPYTNDAQIVGLPSWAKKEHYDIEAKVGEDDVARFKDLKDEQRDEMMKALLMDRFHMAAHLETKQGPVYELVLAKGGSKLVPSKDTPDDAEVAAAKKDGLCAGCSMSSGHEIKAYAVPMSTLLDMLMSATSRVVVDKTGVTGKFSFKLKWTPAEQADAASSQAGSSPDDGSGASLFAALQEQMGLRLVGAKGPVDDVVIEHIEPPSAN